MKWANGISLQSEHLHKDAPVYKCIGMMFFLMVTSFFSSKWKPINKPNVLRENHLFR